MAAAKTYQPYENRKNITPEGQDSIRIPYSKTIRLKSLPQLIITQPDTAPGPMDARDNFTQIISDVHSTTHRGMIKGK
jgi:hypothetical protein